MDRGGDPLLLTCVRCGPEQEFRGFRGLTPAHYEPFNADVRVGGYRKSHIDSLLCDKEVGPKLYRTGSNGMVTGVAQRVAKRVAKFAPSPPPYRSLLVTPTIPTRPPSRRRSILGSTRPPPANSIQSRAGWTRCASRRILRCVSTPASCACCTK